MSAAVIPRRFFWGHRVAAAPPPSIDTLRLVNSE
jgi:hypothetical protein